MASPGSTIALAQTSRVFTDPIVALTVPFAEVHVLQTGKPISGRVFTSRTPASTMSALAQRAMKLVARRSPKTLSADSALMAATTI